MDFDSGFPKNVKFLGGSPTLGLYNIDRCIITVEPRVPRGWSNAFVLTGTRYIRILFYTFYYYWNEEYGSWYRVLCYLGGSLWVPLYLLSSMKFYVLPSRATWSASITWQPRSLNILETVLFPVAIPPVNPTINIVLETNSCCSIPAAKILIRRSPSWTRTAQMVSGILRNYACHATTPRRRDAWWRRDVKRVACVTYMIYSVFRRSDYFDDI